MARRPRLVDLGLLLVAAAAVLNGVIGVLVAVEAAGSRVQVPIGLVVAVVAVSVLYGLALVVAAVLFRRGAVWARSAVLALSAASLLAFFALNALNLLVVLLLIAGDVVLYRRPVSDWVRELRGLVPA